MPAKHCSPVPCPPCDDCKFRALCAEIGPICESFAAFVEGRSRLVCEQRPRIRRNRLTARLRKTYAALTSDGAAERRNGGSWADRDESLHARLAGQESRARAREGA